MSALFNYKYLKCKKCGHDSFFEKNRSWFVNNNEKKEKVILERYLVCVKCNNIFLDPTYKGESN